ncbi:MAG: ATP-binding protein [Steroidobacteraceae bacterium]
MQIERFQAAVDGQAALRDSQLRYQAIFEHSVELIAVLEAVRSAEGAIIDWRYQDANANALHFFGLDLQRLRGKLLTELLPDIAPRLAHVCCQVLETGEPYRYESKVADRAFLVSFFPMGYETVGTSSLDITVRSRAEEQSRQASDATRAEKEWLAAVLGSMTEEVYFTDRLKRYTYANPAALREFGHVTVAGVEFDHIVRRLEVLRPDGTPRPIEEAPPLRALAGEVIRDEEQIVRIPRTGEWRYRQVSAAPVRDSTGQIIGSVSVVRDVTDERRALMELREADRRKDEFLAILAHELRNPLVPIRTGVDLLKDARHRPELIDSVLPMMQRQVDHMVRLIDDLLDVSRISSGKIELHRRPVTLWSVIESAIESNRSTIEAGKLVLAVEIHQRELLLDVDPARFTQVISNLLQNAAKFTPPGGDIRLETALTDAAAAAPSAGTGGAAPAHGAPQRVLSVTVSDTGAGIPPEFLPRAFELFAQARYSETQTGLGIGLTLARRLIELHGGRIEAHSDGVGRGSRFVVHLPLSTEIEPETSESDDSTAALPGTRVLMVDDNRDAADVMALLIEQLGGKATVAYDGASAIEAIKAFRPDVVLLDLGMPGLDGYETCRRLREAYGSRIAVAALSGWGQEQDKSRSAEAGFDAHLTKPAGLEELRRVLWSLAKRRGARKQG